MLRNSTPHVLPFLVHRGARSLATYFGSPNPATPPQPRYNNSTTTAPNCTWTTAHPSQVPIYTDASLLYVIPTLLTMEVSLSRTLASKRPHEHELTPAQHAMIISDL
jgi:hypothetical protein